MTKQALTVCIVLGMLAAAGGCCELNSMLYGPHCGIAICDTTHCYDTPCYPECEPRCGGCGAACGGGYGAACEPECEPCGDVCAEPCCHPCGPLSWLFAIFCHGYCGEDCGELYWSDFHSEPPDCRDPCDCWGGYAANAWSGYCGQCGQAHAGYVAGPQAAVTRPAVPQGTSTTADGYVVGNSSSRYAPRLISVTDRKVEEPTPAKPTPVRQVSQPRRAPAKG